ncbi:hypothetical protein C8F04DRAFT_1276733 [Mycena alexandri]|uniref:Uncharacterized protein n=1 Tax=Mycena alexandri TaxID=1745969 RepID=A0AAD6S166_9AGAR|nr:hypothetical protein C8F04DRAFT_1276733 [Mycena alexandri]
MAGNNAIPSTSTKPTKPRTRATGKKPGKVSWVHGTKEKFFVSRSDEWLSAQRMGTAKLGKFYDDITNLYIQKYGYDLKDEDDLEEDVADPTDPNARDPDMGTLTKEEADRRSKISSTDLLSVGANIGATHPMKMQTWQYYSKLHYEERVKPRFEVAWKAEQQRAKDLDLPEPHVVKVRGEVTRQAWQEESDDFKALVAAAQNKEYAQILRAWELGRAEESSHTAEELHATLKNAALYLQPLADTIQERFSMNVAIMLCGPIGEHGGAIEVRSIHSGTTVGLNPKKWYNFDPVGYQNAEASMVRFSEKTFSEAERERRRVASASSASNEDMPAGSTSSGGAATGTHAGPSGARATGPSGGAGDIVERGGAFGWNTAATPRAMKQHRRRPHGKRLRHRAKRLSQREHPRRCMRHGDEKTWWSGRKSFTEHTARLRWGRKWPEDWARLVNEYLDFEAAAGYPDEGPRIVAFAAKDQELGEAWGRKRSYADNWWMWWRSLQPSGREVVEETGMMTMPMEMEWGKLTKMSGRNGFFAGYGEVGGRGGGCGGYLVRGPEVGGGASTWKKGARGKKRNATDMEVEEGGRHSKRIAGEKIRRDEWERNARRGREDSRQAQATAGEVYNYA